MNERRGHFFLGLLVAALAIVGGATASGAQGRAELSESTKSLLGQHQLKREARRDPAEAIRKLDQLTAEGDVLLGAGTIAIVEVALRAGSEATGSESLGYYLCAADQTLPYALARAAEPRSEDKTPAPALELHNRAIEGLIGALQSSNSAALAGTEVEIPGPLATYQLSWQNAGEEWTPDTHDFVPASELPHRKVTANIRRPGLGAGLVAIRKGDVPAEPELEGGVFAAYRYFYALTALLEISETGTDKRATVRLVDPRRADTVTLDGKIATLTLDMGAQFSAMLREIDLATAKGGMVRPERHLSTMGLYVVEPPRPDKIPVVLTHGLNSSPLTWTDAYGSFLQDEEIRESYQFWFFAYPTGLPYPLSAAILRRNLVDLIRTLDTDGQNPLIQSTVLVGHSLGGLLTRFQVIETGTSIWDALFRLPADQLELPPDDIALLEDSLVIEALPFVERAIFVSTPHRGTSLAKGKLGNLAGTVVKLPEDLRDLSHRVALLDSETASATAKGNELAFDSVTSLEPDSAILIVLDGLGVYETITFHTVVGDQGKGSPPETRSDGLVPYSSSGLEGVASELVVPSGHSAHRHPDGIAELQRILIEHLRDVQ